MSTSPIVSAATRREVRRLGLHITIPLFYGIPDDGAAFLYRLWTFSVLDMASLQICNKIRGRGEQIQICEFTMTEEMILSHWTINCAVWKEKWTERSLKSIAVATINRNARHFLEVLEKALGKNVEKSSTWWCIPDPVFDVGELCDFDFRPELTIRKKGTGRFAQWYKSYYKRV